MAPAAAGGGGGGGSKRRQQSAESEAANDGGRSGERWQRRLRSTETRCDDERIEERLHLACHLLGAKSRTFSEPS